MARTKKTQPQSEQMEMPAPSGLLDVEGAAAWLGVSRAKLFQLMHEEGFPVIVIPDRVIRFDPNSLYKWALEKQVNGRYVA
jgi:predicted DNA-binding transcriptional regulator AlpA